MSCAAWDGGAGIWPMAHFRRRPNLIADYMAHKATRPAGYEKNQGIPNTWQRFIGRVGACARELVRDDRRQIATGIPLASRVVD
eukprot:scaffold4185_cov59-Phaeocystis_antarctica.AAC.3